MRPLASLRRRPRRRVVSLSVSVCCNRRRSGWGEFRMFVEAAGGGKAQGAIDSRRGGQRANAFHRNSELCFWNPGARTSWLNSAGGPGRHRHVHRNYKKTTSLLPKVNTPCEKHNTRYSPVEPPSRNRKNASHHGTHDPAPRDASPCDKQDSHKQISGYLRDAALGVANLLVLYSANSPRQGHHELRVLLQRPRYQLRHTRSFDQRSPHP